MKYTVEISPDAVISLDQYVEGASSFGDCTVNEIIEAYEKCIETLEMMPNIGFKRLKYIPKKYRMFHMWKHYWVIYQVIEDANKVIIEYLIDDRQNYGDFIT